MLVRTAAKVLLPVVLVAGSSLLGGCRVHHEVRYANETVAEDRIHVRVSTAHVRGDRVVVKTWVHNQSDRPIAVRRSDLGLKLADGTVLHGMRGRRHDRPVVIAPGHGRFVKVGFRAPAGAEIGDARLVMSGVRVGQDAPRTLGDVAFSRRGTTFVLGGQEPAEADEEAAQQQAEIAEAAATEDPQDAEEVEDVEAEEPEDDGSWQIGTR
jgi:hypothetical protein